MSDSTTWSPSSSPAGDLDRVHGAAADAHLDALGVTRGVDHLEERDRALLLAERRAADLQRALEAFQLDRAVDAEVGHRAARQRRGQAHVNGDGSIRGGRILAAHAAGHDAVARVDLRQLAHFDVLGLRFRNAQLRLQTCRVRHAGQVLTRCDPLAHIDRHLLQDAGEPGANL